MGKVIVHQKNQNMAAPLTDLCVILHDLRPPFNGKTIPPPIPAR